MSLTPVQSAWQNSDIHSVFILQHVHRVSVYLFIHIHVHLNVVHINITQPLMSNTPK